MKIKRPAVDLYPYAEFAFAAISTRSASALLPRILIHAVHCSSKNPRPFRRIFLRLAFRQRESKTLDGVGAHRVEGEINDCRNRNFVDRSARRRITFIEQWGTSLYCDFLMPLGWIQCATEDRPQKTKDSEEYLIVPVGRGFILKSPPRHTRQNESFTQFDSRL